ncbi:hypothetical protein [Nostoc sp.]
MLICLYFMGDRCYFTTQYPTHRLGCDRTAVKHKNPGETNRGKREKYE